MQTKGKEEEDDPYSLEVGEKNSKAFFSWSEGMLLIQDKGGKFWLNSFFFGLGVLHIGL